MYGPGGGFISLKARYKGYPAGYARIAINGDRAELADVQVYCRPGHWSRWPPFYYRSVNYRERGIGTRLLDKVLDICQAQGVSWLEGKMHGDVDQLTRWYGRHGFRIGPGNEIHREILV